MRSVVSDEVGTAVTEGRAVVALETSVIAQGLPVPTNAEVASALEAAVRGRGAVPAWVAVDRGALRVGIDAGTLERLALPGEAVKVARRDVPAALAAGALGGTTVSATVWAAARAGIALMATGGIGGVHPGSGDVSGDLAELSRTPGMLVCSGPKSIVDPVATVERLDELGVLLVGFGVRRLPFFLAREAPVELEHAVDHAAAAAALVRTALDLGTGSAIVLCNPVPAAQAMDAERVASAVASCQERARRDRVDGKRLTPYLLACLAEATGGASLRANVALLEANATLAADVAVAVSRTGEDFGPV